MRKQKLLQTQKKIHKAMADKLMQDVDEIESSSVEESNGPDAVNEERMKKEEIM